MADKEWKKRLNDNGYKNWLKVSLALIESKEALHDFTKRVMVAVHHDIKSNVGPGICTGCNTNKGKAPTCPSCSQWVTKIKAKSGGMLQWKNADPQKWHNTPWEVAKCYMNAQGSKTTAAANTGPDKTDLSGMLNVLVNCKEFGLNHLKNKKLPEHVRTVRNELMHCATMSFTDAEMQDKVNTVIKLLEDDVELKNLPICQEKVQVIESLRDDKFELKPKDECLCIDTALKCHALSVESGDNNMKYFFNKLSEMVKGNKDLEMKFDDRLNKLDEKLKNVKEETDAQFSSVNFSLGEISGKVEFLMGQIVSGSSFPSTPTSSVLGSHEIKSLFKNILQSYAQKKKFDLPDYNSYETEGKQFVSTVCVNGKEFNSKEPKQSKKEAEQSAAEEALRILGNDDSEIGNGNNESSSTMSHQAIDSSASTKLLAMDSSPLSEHQTKDSKSLQQKENYKNMLQERAQRLNISLPIYDDKITDNGFLSDVMFDGRWYSPDMSPQNRKIDAQQKAAEFVVAFLHSENEKSEISSNNEPPTRANDTNKIEGREVTPTKNVLKPFKVILNEHVQKITKGQLPNYDVVKDSDGKFVCTVEALGEVYKSPSGMNSIGDAKESAASEACKILKLAESAFGNSARREEDLNPDKEQTPLVEPTSEEIGGSTGQKSSTGEATDTSNASPPAVDKPDGKTYRSMLNEYAQKMAVKSPEYEEIPSADKEFRSRVKLLDKTFECVGSYPNKKRSQEMAAMEAMKYFQALSLENCTKINNETSASELDSGKIEHASSASRGAKPENASTTTCDLSSNTAPGISTVTSETRSSTAQQNTTITMVTPVSRKGQVPFVERQSDPKETDNPDGQLMPILTTKTQPSFKNTLIEYARKNGLDHKYETSQDSTSKNYISKVFIGKRCFKGVEWKAKLKEAEKHVAEITMNILEGRSSELDCNCEELLKAFHKALDLPTFPKYNEVNCIDDGKFRVEVKVAKKYEIVCNDTKPRRKDAEISLAEQALKLLEHEKKIPPNNENAKSRLNLLLQSQGTLSKLQYNVQGQGDPCMFSGHLCFFLVDVYESLTFQPSKEKAITSAAMSACNGMDLL